MQKSAQIWPWRWCLYWLLLPNIVVIAMWPIGGPPMGRMIVISGCLALVFSQIKSVPIRRLSVLLLTAVVAFEYVVDSFNLEAIRIDAAGEFFANAKPLASVEYFVGLIIVSAAMGISAYGIAKVDRFCTTSQWLMGIAAVLAFAQLDTLATAATSNSYKKLPNDGTQFASAVQRSRLVNLRAGSARNHVVVILVEALGVPAFPEGERLFQTDWNRLEWRTRYDVRLGKVPYYGSTTNGELRELCGKFANFDSFDFSKNTCMPALYAQAGYDTLAIHAFDGALFDRETWWPKLGFAETRFTADVLREGARQCGGMWPGACDVDIAGQIARRLNDADRPQFVYWVTLNSHLPVLSGATPDLDGCEDGTAPLADTSLLRCRLFLAHHNIAQAISKLAMDPNLPPTDFLIVGDHMPPFMQRKERLAFDGYNVPWIMLRSADKNP